MASDIPNCESTRCFVPNRPARLRTGGSGARTVRTTCLHILRLLAVTQFLALLGSDDATAARENS